jgi:cytochrome c5
MMSILVLSLLSAGCYYDVEETLYDGGCPERVATYDATIAEIIDNNCVVCHSGPNADAGLSLTTYSEVRDAALNGALLNRILLPGSNPASMPPNGELGVCKIERIQAWIDAGAPEN